ncbi:MAG: hypothetical protein ACR2IF_02390 [Terriglobales bacterium]
MLADTFAKTPLCRHVRLDNKPCGQPALRATKFCRFHTAARLRRPGCRFPVLEDALSLQYAIMQVLRALTNHEVDRHTAAILLYGLQIASSNLKRLNEQVEAADDLDTTEESLAESFVKQLGLSEPDDPAVLAREEEARRRAAAGATGAPVPWPLPLSHPECAAAAASPMAKAPAAGPSPRSECQWLR